MHTFTKKQLQKIIHLWGIDVKIPTKVDKPTNVVFPDDNGMEYSYRYATISRYDKRSTDGRVLYDVVFSGLIEVAPQFKLEFRNDIDGCETVYVGTGDTLFQALADIELQMWKALGVRFDEIAHFTRDFQTFYDDLDEVGGVWDCHDFSAPEDRFTITRLS